jgi:hypothetical protein
MADIVDKIYPPNKLIHAPYGTLYRVDGDLAPEMYIQVGENEQEPCWISMGNFLLNVFSDELYDKNFIETCLKKYKSPAPRV